MMSIVKFLNRQARVLFFLAVVSVWLPFAPSHAGTVATRYETVTLRPLHVQFERDHRVSLDSFGDTLNFRLAIDTAAYYLRSFQADVTEDNAGNGTDGLNESPDDPDDAGWDWVLNWTNDPHSHSSSSSPDNIYGTTAYGLLRAFQITGKYELWVALVDAADRMVAADTTAMRSSADIKFLLLFDDQYDFEIGPTSVYSDAARAKYDHLISSYGSAAVLAQSIRDTRGITQGYPNGIIGWDIGAYAVAAEMLFARYGGSYHQDAVDIAEVLYQDSYADTPGLFDVVDDAGWDPGYANVNYWWYTLGISGLLDAFKASNTHPEVWSDLTSRLIASQYSTGAFSFSYGANAGDEDWQSTAYSVMSLHAFDMVQFDTEIRNAAYWIGATQSPQGGWRYSNEDHYPAIGGENLAALTYGSPADTVWVDDNWAGQTDVNVFNSANNSKLVWGYSAFGNIKWSLAGTDSRTIYIRAGLYVGQVHPRNFDYLEIIGAGEDSTILRAPATTMPDIYFAGGPSRPILFIDNSLAYVSNLTIDGDGRGSNNSRMIGVAYWNSDGVFRDAKILNVRDTPLNNGSQGVGISVNRNDGQPHDVTIRNTYIAGFQKNGTGFTGAGVNVTCENVTVVGIGPTSTVIQNGIQYSPGTTGVIRNCSVSNIQWSSSLWIASSILLFEADQVDITGTTVTGCQTGIYSIDTDGDIDSCSVTASPSVSLAGKQGIRFYAAGAALAGLHDMPQMYDESIADERLRDHVLDENEVVNVRRVSITGNLSNNSYGILTQVDGGVLDLTIDSCEVVGWSRGIDISASNVSATTVASVRNTRLNNVINAFDNRPNHVWDSNCYSDYTSNFGFPGTYEISGSVPWNLDVNPNPNGCYEVNLVTDGEFIGCDGSECAEGDICLTLGSQGLPNLQLTMQLPSGYALALPPGGGVVTPSSDADTCLIQAFAIDQGGGSVLIDIGFQWPGSVGDISKKIACIPVINMSNGTGIHAAQLNSSLWIDSGGGEHQNDLDLGVGVVKVDCDAPVINSVQNLTSCAFGSASQVANQFSVTFSDALSGLDSAWVTFQPSGGSYAFLASEVTSPQTLTFPADSDTALFYSLLATDTCNTLTIRVRDSECNVSNAAVILNIGRDNSAPLVSILVNQPDGSCLNNSPASPNYGGILLDSVLDITALVGGQPCSATTGTLIIAHADVSDFVVQLDQTSYPEDDSSALALWTWMLDVPGFMIANGDTFTFDVWTSDCAGNISAVQQFAICVDMQLPENTFTSFDARPAHLGVWLKWSWESSLDAEEMRIYRSPISGEYPAYPNDLWSQDSNYTMTSLPPSGWTLVATQSSFSGAVTSGSFIGTPNNRGDSYYHVDGADTFWLDAEAGWLDGTGNAATYRDIYRYVTFVKDAGGNWSIGDTVEIGINADRSTNYWLGDFSTADGSGDPNSRGRVDTDDLSLLSAVYFTNAGDYRNIGPVVIENWSVGKGIPNPDLAGAIDFDDLTPFSFNFHSVSPVGITETEFAISPDPSRSRPAIQLDNSPYLELLVREESTFALGDEFDVLILLRGNETGIAKAVEAKLQYDETALHAVSVYEGNPHSSAGVVFNKVRLLDAQDAIGLVAASCGGTSTLSGNCTIASIRFRVTADVEKSGGLLLTSIRILDAAANVLELSDQSMRFGASAAIPESVELLQNYPNPFNASTVIRYEIPDAANVTLTVYNTNGQAVATLQSGLQEAGRHEIQWNAADVASGIYVYVLKYNEKTLARKMILIH